MTGALVLPEVIAGMAEASTEFLTTADGRPLKAALAAAQSRAKRRAFLLVLRPFKVGEFISAGGVTGTVQEIGLFATTILTPDNVKTVVGNNKIFSDNVHNYSTNPVRRVERTAQLANGVDPFQAMALLRTAVAAIPNVASAPAPEISLLDFQPQGPVIAVRPYTHNDHYWQVYFDTNEAIARVAGANSWPVPAPMHIHKNV